MVARGGVANSGTVRFAHPAPQQRLVISVRAEGRCPVNTLGGCCIQFAEPERDCPRSFLVSRNGLDFLLARFGTLVHPAFL